MGYIRSFRHLEGMDFFKGAGGPQHQWICVARPDDLQSHRQAQCGEPARDDTGRLAREIEGIGEWGLVHPIVLTILVCQILPDRKGGYWHGWRHQKIIRFMEQVHLMP